MPLDRCCRFIRCFIMPSSQSSATLHYAQPMKLHVTALKVRRDSLKFIRKLTRRHHLSELRSQASHKCCAHKARGLRSADGRAHENAEPERCSAERRFGRRL